MSNEKTSIEVKEDTGEVIENNTCDNERPRKEEIKGFNSMWYNFNGVEPGDDLSNEIEDIYEEVPPYAIDTKTGKFLNETSVPKIVKIGSVNVQDRIQSFAKEVDLYSILEKFAYSDDPALINARPCAYGDISELPNDLNGFAQYCKVNFDKLHSMNPELANMVFDENISCEAIEAKAKEILQNRVNEFKNEKGDNE